MRYRRGVDVGGTFTDLLLFDYAPGSDALRKSCAEKTGLPAPIQPVWKTAPVADSAE